MNKSGCNTCGVGASPKPEKIDFVSIEIVLDQKSVGFEDKPPTVERLKEAFPKFNSI
jgi:hypothetical protein